MSDPIWLLPAAAQLLAPFVSVTTVTLVEGDWVVILRKKMNIFLNIQLFQKRPSPKQLSEYLWNREDKKGFCRVSQSPFSSLFFVPTLRIPGLWNQWKMPPLRRPAIARAFTSAVQFSTHAPTTLPPWQVPWGPEMADGFLQTTKPNNKNNIRWAIQFDFYPQRRNC